MQVTKWQADQIRESAAAFERLRVNYRHLPEAKDDVADAEMILMKVTEALENDALMRRKVAKESVVAMLDTAMAQLRRARELVAAA